MKILKACGVCLLGLLIALALIGASTKQPETTPAQPTSDTSVVKVTSIDALTGTVTRLHTEKPTSSALPKQSQTFLYAPMKLYELDGDKYIEVDFITDDFDTLPERWLYVLLPDREYVAVADLSACPPLESLSGGCFHFNNNLSAGEVGSICLVSTWPPTESTVAQTISYSQIKFVTDDDINLHHGKTDQLVGRAGYYNGQAYLQLTCQSGTLDQSAIEQATYCTTNATNQAVALGVYGSETGICTPYELDSDTYLWPSQHQENELQDIFRQINEATSEFYRATATTSVAYAISKAMP